MRECINEPSGGVAHNDELLPKQRLDPPQGQYVPQAISILLFDPITNFSGSIRGHEKKRVKLHFPLIPVPLYTQGSIFNFPSVFEDRLDAFFGPVDAVTTL